ncbi:uncharacterized protein [Procambarus clarkii]|uniref:uncharacterized protein n=1 Tax=Procambarus clarkii TaxID=6728 RepID=UPI001E67823A|nr:uncharacterized protein LOC123773472 [Procambarus clarkii]
MMWRIFGSIARGVRCVRASHLFCQESVEEHKPHSKKVVQQHSLAPLYYSLPTSCHNKDDPIFKSVNGVHRWENQVIRTLENDLKGKEEKHQRSGRDRDVFTAGYNSSTPWHWEVLLDSTQDKPLGKEEKKQENGKQTHDRDGTCPLQQWGCFLSTYSILQAVGWGSAVALTWSLYHDWGVLRCKYKRQGQDYFCNSEQKTKSWYNEADTLVSKCQVNYSEHYQYIKDQAYYESQQHEDDMPHLHHFFSHETSQSPFGFFWNIAANQFELKKTMFSKATLKDKSLDSLLNNRIIPDLHKDLQLFQDKNTSQTKQKQSCKYGTEVPITKEAHFSMQNTYSIQDNTILFEDSECCQNPKLFIKPQPTKLEEEDIKQSDTDKESLLLDKAKSEEDRDVRCTKGVQKTARLEESVSALSDPSIRQSSLKREEVLLEDCTCDDSGQNVGASDSSQHLDAEPGIIELSDSFMEILKAESQGIKIIQDQLLGVMEGEILSAVTHFKAGALLGDPSAVFNLALCYQLGHGVTQDLKMARELYETASEAGHGWATYNLAVLMSRGQGGPSDSDRMYSLLVKAEKMGVPEAQEALRKLKSDNYFWKEDTMKSSRSEPAFASVSSSRWSSSYSTSDLEFMDESDVFISSDLSTDLNRSENTSLFYIG